MKKDYKKRLFLLHINVDSCIPADNTVLNIITDPCLVPFVGLHNSKSEQ